MLIWDSLIFPFKEKNSLKDFLPFIIITAICCFIESTLTGFTKQLPLIASILCSIIIYIISYLYPIGYLTVLAHNKIKEKEEIIPKWNNFIEYGIKGFLVIIITNIYISSSFPR